MPYAVHYSVDKPESFTRLQLLIRMVAFIAVGVVGLSFGTVFLFAYLALPAFAASRLAASPDTYVDENGPQVLRVLHWLAAICAWAGLINEHLPGRIGEAHVHIDLEGSAHPNPRSALLRVLTGIPSALVLGVLCWIGVFVWLWAALSILLNEQVGSRAFHYLEGLQRWSIRLLVYQASLVDEYPPFSFSDTPPLPRELIKNC